jgi:motility quorum-sensing regulator/GCU-specific mRNA interferase toxin
VKKARPQSGAAQARRRAASQVGSLGKARHSLGEALHRRSYISSPSGCFPVGRGTSFFGGSRRELAEYTLKVYIAAMSVKRRPHHDLRAVQARFASVETLEITTTALRSAGALGFALADVVEVVQALEPRDFVKSETAHSPPNPHCWHDTYVTPWFGQQLYLKFAGETLIDVVLTSFKER